MGGSLLAALLLASACNFTIAGFQSQDRGDAGSTQPGTSAPDGAAPADLATAHDLATPPDLYTPMPDLTPLPDKVGDACAGACGAGLTCMNWVPSGYCSESCASSDSICPPGSTCVDTSGGNGAGARYCLVNANGGGNCTRQDLQCRDCSAKVCGPSNFCDGC